MSVLADIILEERHRQRWQDYTASALWMIGRMFAGDSWGLPAYTELAYPNLVKKDKRTAEEIKGDLLRRLTA